MTTGEAIQFNERRIYLRHPIKLLIEVKTGKESEAVVTETGDLSQGGVSFIANWQMPIGHEVSITFIFGQKSFQMKGRVSYCQENPRTWSYYTGVSFLDPSGTFYVKLAKQFIELIQQADKKTPKKNIQVYEVVSETSFMGRLKGLFAKKGN